MFVYYNKKAYCPWLGKDVDRLVAAVARKEKKVRGDLEINIVSLEEIKKLNRQYRGLNRPTDVLSFAWQEDRKIKTKNLGQIYLCYTQIVKQAKANGLPAKEEFVRILVHGLLHLVGYDHCAEQGARKMFKLQEKIVDNYVQ